VNDTRWFGSDRAGLDQIFLTLGVVVGRIELVGRVKLGSGFGYQAAVAATIRAPLTPQFRDNLIITTRFAF
jgi:hypothetical protein